jgi:hypothetical protein
MDNNVLLISIIILLVVSLGLNIYNTYKLQMLSQESFHENQMDFNNSLGHLYHENLEYMGGPSAPMGGNMGGPSAPMGGTMGGPSVHMGGTMGGPSAPMGGPSAPMGGTMGGPSAPMGGTMGGPSAPMYHKGSINGIMNKPVSKTGHLNGNIPGPQEMYKRFNSR